MCSRRDANVRFGSCVGASRYCSFPGRPVHREPCRPWPNQRSNANCAGAVRVTMPQRLEQEAMAWQARTDFAFNLYRGFAFRSSTLPKGDRLLLDDIAEQGAGATAGAADALAELRSHEITCVLAPTTAQDTIANLEPTLGTPTIAVMSWSGRTHKPRQGAEPRTANVTGSGTSRA